MDSMEDLLSESVDSKENFPMEVEDSMGMTKVTSGRQIGKSQPVPWQGVLLSLLRYWHRLLEFDQLVPRPWRILWQGHRRNPFCVFQKACCTGREGYERLQAEHNFCLGIYPAHPMRSVEKCQSSRTLYQHSYRVDKVPCGGPT